MSLNNLKRKISSIGSTKKITNAMCLIATAKLKKQRSLFESLKDYFYDFYKIVNVLLDGDNDEIIKTLSPKDSKKSTLYLNINSSFGLCGSYNATLNSYAHKLLQPNDKIVQFGKQGLEYLSVNQIQNEVIEYYDFNDQKPSYNICLDIANKILSMLTNGEFTEIKVNYMYFVNALVSKPVTIDVIPFDKEMLENISKDKKEKCEYEYNPNKKEILLHLLPDYIATVIYGALIEAKVSEYASRRNSMDLATKNAKELGDKYLLQFNNERQAQITKEIVEILGGSTVSQKNKKKSFDN